MSSQSQLTAGANELLENSEYSIGDGSGWFILVRNNSILAHIQFLSYVYSSGYLTQDTNAWSEGLSYCQSLSSIPGLLEDAPAESAPSSIGEEVFSTVNADDSVKEEVFDASEAVVDMQNGKRKLPGKKSDEKTEGKKEANQPPDTWFELKVNTHVYVTGLPDDGTVEVFYLIY